MCLTRRPAGGRAPAPVARGASSVVELDWRHGHQRLELEERLLPDAADVHQILDLLEAAVLLAVLDDPRGRRRTDARQQLELGTRCRIQVDWRRRALLNDAGRRLLRLLLLLRAGERGQAHHHDEHHNHRHVASTHNGSSWRRADVAALCGLWDPSRPPRLRARSASETTAASRIPRLLQANARPTEPWARDVSANG